MKRMLAGLALGGALMLALPPTAALAMGRFNKHGGIDKRDALVNETPEIDVGAAQSAIAVLVAGLLILVERRRRN